MARRGQRAPDLGRTSKRLNFAQDLVNGAILTDLHFPFRDVPFFNPNLDVLFGRPIESACAAQSTGLSAPRPLPNCFDRS